MCSKYHLVSLLNEKQRSTFANFLHLFYQCPLLTYSAMALPKAILICSLLTLSQSRLFSRMVGPVGLQETNDGYTKVARSLAPSHMCSAEVLWRTRHTVRGRRNWISCTLEKLRRRLADTLGKEPINGDILFLTKNNQRQESMVYP